METNQKKIRDDWKKEENKPDIVSTSQLLRALG